MSFCNLVEIVKLKLYCVVIKSMLSYQVTKYYRINAYILILSNYMTIKRNNTQFNDNLSNSLSDESRYFLEPKNPKQRQYEASLFS